MTESPTQKSVFQTLNAFAGTWVGKLLSAFLFLIILLGVGWHYLTSPRRDLEVSFGVHSLPQSVSHIDVRVDAWTDYVVRGYFEISPQDFDKLIAARPYEKIEPLRDAPDPEFAHGHKATVGYHWNAGDKVTHCGIFADESKSWISFLYGTE